MKVKVNTVITSKEGCLIRIVGTVSYTLVPPEITEFSGTVTLSGAGDCPQGTLSFAIAPPNGNSGADLDVNIDDRNLYKVSRVTWINGTKPVPKILKEDIVNEVLIREFRKIADENPYCDNDVNVNVNVNVNVKVDCNKK